MQETMIRLTIKELVIEIPVKLFELYDQQRNSAPMAPQHPVEDYRTVAETPENVNNDFWRNYIGQKVAIIKQTPDGLLDVLLSDQPIPVEGISPSRFT